MNWRLLRDGAASGAWNMAVDEALLRAHAAGLAPPTVRFYGWEPACLSLGRFQEYSRLPALETSPSTFDIVRRPTGGRAVWHQHEITYSAVVREELLPSGATSVVGAYRWLSAGLVRGLASLGIDAALARAQRSTPSRSTPSRSTPSRSTPRATPAHEENCFNSAAQCDFLVDGRKLIGAAQARKRGAVLQHGSILLEVDEEMWHKALGSPLHHSISLRELGVRASRAEIIGALTRGLEGTLQTTLQSKSLTEAEETMAARLYDEKYRQALWTRNGKLLAT